MSKDLIVRHKLFDRIFHWLFALSILTLLGTGLLPVLGLLFDWVTIHWTAGILFALLTVVHVLRIAICKDWRSMWIGRRDIRLVINDLSQKDEAIKPGKYSVAQKCMHNATGVLGLFAIISGLVMMVRIDTPFWERNPYWLEPPSWGYIYVVHGLLSLAFVSLVMIHIYFSLRPEKFVYLRSMISGLMSKQEVERYHDTALWRCDEPENPLKKEEQ